MGAFFGRANRRPNFLPNFYQAAHLVFVCDARLRAMSAPQPSRPALVRDVSTYRGSKILPLLALLLIGAAANAAARPMPHASEHVLACRLAGRWQQWTHGVGPSAWSVAPTGAARERGLGNATGTARFLRPRVLRLDWTIPVGVGGVRWSGFYLWRLADCDNGGGWLTFTRGPRASEIHASSLVRTG